MTIETILTCPLGSKCEEIRDNKIHRCAWFTQLAGTNPATGEQVDERGCAITWMPILLVENSKQQRSTSAAVESFRNEVVAANEQARHQAFLPRLAPEILG
ncbi:hypothetical protein [Rhodoferax sp. WC2427]|uniref:hypothetical protein n=1 Tax=Rhodoferax sp. WC2427 TaxID=3234144 RepID=UPI003467CBA3